MEIWERTWDKEQEKQRANRLPSIKIGWSGFTEAVCFVRFWPLLRDQYQVPWKPSELFQMCTSALLGTGGLEHRSVQRGKPSLLVCLGDLQGRCVLQRWQQCSGLWTKELNCHPPSPLGCPQWCPSSASPLDQFPCDDKQERVNTSKASYLSLKCYTKS